MTGQKAICWSAIREITLDIKEKNNQTRQNYYPAGE